MTIYKVAGLKAIFMHIKIFKIKVKCNDYRKDNLKEIFKVKLSRVHSKWNGSARHPLKGKTTKDDDIV